MIEISALSSSAKNKPLRCEGTTATKDTRHIQVHVAKNLLYYTANSSNPTTANKTQLLRFELSSKSHWVVVQDMEDPDDIAFDWVGEKMYSCHSKLNQIKAWDVVTGISSVIYSDRFTAKVSELAIDPHRANLFWISYEMDNPNIYQGSFTGVAPIKLVSSASLTKPMGISFEYLDDRLVNLVRPVISSGQFISPGQLISSDYLISSDPCKVGNGGCDDLCFRKGKEVSCMCDFGRTLDPVNNRSCKAVPMTNNFMLVTDLLHDRIIQISNDGKRIVSLPINNLMTPAMARYGHHDNMLYWTEVGSKSIRRGTLDGTVNQKLLGVGGETYADRFAIDFTTGQLFYTVSHSKELDKGYIAVMKPKLAQNETKQLITKLHYPGGIAIDPKKGYIYYNSHGAQVYIARADTDGTNIQTIVNFTQSGGTPLGLTIDYQNNVLYWADSFTDQDKIEYIDLNTNARSLLRKDMTSDVVDLLVSDGFLYYVGYNRHKITKVNINTKQLAAFMDDQPEFGAIDSVDIVPTANTQPVNTQCSQGNGGCSHYCFSKPSGRVCGCPDNLYLDQTTQSTCTTAPPTCPMTIPNGQLNPGCTARSGTSCGYSCISDRFMKNPNVNILTCTPSMFWDHPTDTLCIEKVCNTTMPAGTLLNCQGKAGEMCGWACPANLQKKPYLEQVVCLNSGQWSTPLGQLCVPKVKCNSAIANGILQSCSYDAGDSCSVRCNTNFKAAYDRIYCLPDGAWDQNVQTICKPIIVTTCPSTVNKGSLENCTYETDKSCRVRCISGYSPALDFIHCLPDGVWDKDTNTLCEVTKVTTPEKQTAPAANNAGLTAAVVVVVILFVIVIALGVTFYVCRRRIFTPTDKQSVQGRYRSSPNVYFNASDSRGEVPAQGFINPVLHATNGDAMPNTDPLKMDQINLSDDPNKENARNDGHYDVIKEGKAAAAGGAGVHEAVNPLYSSMSPQEEIKFPSGEEVKEKPGYQRFS
ncbi:low-density lipoprotein receptor-related protein 5-like [Argopecten irradians]|uniref:low-density lipoprotein receptor-related protein 5-like n=1 Tax=Argopecten irradians TaxID=31199 RepID=UPI00371A93EA